MTPHEWVIPFHGFLVRLVVLSIAEAHEGGSGHE